MRRFASGLGTESAKNTQSSVVSPQSSLPRMRPADRALAGALDQLRAGVPLNWSQMEDDAELVTLSALQGAARQVREAEGGPAPAALRAGIFKNLAARLPQPEPEPVKAPPKALAGFSENVPVLTQVEDDVPALTSNMWQWIGATIAVGLVVILVFWIGSSVFALFRPKPAFTWIDVRYDGKPLFSQRTPDGWKPPQCSEYDITNPAAERNFINVPDRQQLELLAGFPVDFLPQTLTVPTTYTLRLQEMAVAPCVDVVPDPQDTGSTVRLSYSARRQLDNGYADISPLVVFQGRQQPISISVTTAAWKEVRVGDAHGIYWRGGPYRDLAGTGWIGEVSVMIVERGDFITTYVGKPEQGITEEMLVGLLRQMEQANLPAQGAAPGASPSFDWIELRQNGRVIAPSQLSQAAGQGCGTPTGTSPGFSRFRYVGSLDNAQTEVGFPVLSLPESITMPVTAAATALAGAPSSTPAALQGITMTLAGTFTMALADAAVRSCVRDGGLIDATRAALKLRYAVRRLLPGSDPARLPDVFVFQTRLEPTTVDVGSTPWRAVSVGAMRGVYLQGPYRDPEGIFWDAANVLVLEKDGTIITLLSNVSAPPNSSVGVVALGSSEELVMAFAAALR